MTQHTASSPCQSSSGVHAPLTASRGSGMTRHISIIYLLLLLCALISFSNEMFLCASAEKTSRTAPNQKTSIYPASLRIQFRKNIGEELGDTSTENHLLNINISSQMAKRLANIPGIQKIDNHNLSLLMSYEKQLDLISEQLRGNDVLSEEWNRISSAIIPKAAVQKETATRGFAHSSIFRSSPSTDRNETEPLYVHHNYEDVTFLLKKWASMYSSIMTLHSAGKSVQGREMWYVTLSGKRLESESPLKPAFKYVGNIHGDEVVGREMLVHFIFDIVTNYCCTECGDTGCVGTERQQRITKLLNTADVFIMPSMNPDGYEARRRENAHNVDMNRNFPDQYFDPKDSSAGREPEVQNMMRFIRAYPFVLSANLHGGALVANYPFDGTKDRSNSPNAAPDDQLFRQLALSYSNAHRKMHSSTEFSQGITQGSAWYSLYGGMQDYNYLWNNVLALTMELSNVKYPSASTLEGFWGDNKNALLTYAEQIYQGIYGVVLDENGSYPLSASIEIEGNEKKIASFPRGDFYRLLTPGSYRCKVSADGYESSVVDVEVKKGTPTRVEVRLQRTAKGGDDSKGRESILAGYSSRFTVGVLSFFFSLFLLCTCVFIIVRFTFSSQLEKMLPWYTSSEETHQPHEPLAVGSPVPDVESDDENFV